MAKQKSAKSEAEKLVGQILASDAKGGGSVRDWAEQQKSRPDQFLKTGAAHAKSATWPAVAGSWQPYSGMDVSIAVTNVSQTTSEKDLQQAINSLPPTAPCHAPVAISVVCIPVDSPEAQKLLSHVTGKSVHPKTNVNIDRMVSGQPHAN